MCKTDIILNAECCEALIKADGLCEESLTHGYNFFITKSTLFELKNLQVITHSKDIPSYIQVSDDTTNEPYCTEEDFLINTPQHVLLLFHDGQPARGNRTLLFCYLLNIIEHYEQNPNQQCNTQHTPRTLCCVTNTISTFLQNLYLYLNNKEAKKGLQGSLAFKYTNNHCYRTLYDRVNLPLVRP